MEKKFLEKILADFKKKRMEFDIYIIADVQKKTEIESHDNVIHANESEFFTRTEFAQIASAIFDAFGFVKVFYSETEFIKYILDNKIKREDCLIYNFARDGFFEGKKSLVPAFCDLLNLRYTGSNAFVLSLLRNKYIYSLFLEKHKILVPKTYKYHLEKGFLDSKPRINTKIIAKQVFESASIGITSNNIFVYTNSTANQVYLDQLCNDLNTKELLVQEFIDGIECEVLVLKQNEEFKALDPIALKIKNSNIIDSNISNAYDYMFILLESLVPKKVCTQIKKTAEKSAKLLNINTYARFDFRIDSSNNLFYLIDIAGTPYTIYHSSIAYLFTNVYELQYKDIYKTIVSLSI